MYHEGVHISKHMRSKSTITSNLIHPVRFEACHALRTFFHMFLKTTIFVLNFLFKIQIQSVLFIFRTFKTFNSSAENTNANYLETFELGGKYVISSRISKIVKWNKFFFKKCSYENCNSNSRYTYTVLWSVNTHQKYPWIIHWVPIFILKSSNSFNVFKFVNQNKNLYLVSAN